MGAAALEADPPLALLVLDEVCGAAGVPAIVIPGSDLRPNEYPSAKNSAQMPTSPKNSTSSFPVPNVISVSSDEAIGQLQLRATSVTPSAHNPRRRLP